MKRDKTHLEQIERWAKYIRENPDKWKSKFNDFINAQVIMSRRFYSKLSKTKEGREKIKLLRDLNKNQRKSI